ncbi:MAG: hypothetical protein HOC74_30480, partial [Gemmatimonadetes bacterium]|nr:hypothetical protein [Gemmatimonadota bacterium]
MWGLAVGIAADHFVHHPAGARGGAASAGAGAAAEQIVYYGLEQRLLDVLGAGGGDLLDAGCGLQPDRVEVEGGEGDGSLVAVDLDAV